MTTQPTPQRPIRVGASGTCVTITHFCASAGCDVSHAITPDAADALIADLQRATGTTVDPNGVTR